MQKITPFLWYDNQAEEAANFYISLFKNSKIGDIALMHTRRNVSGPQTMTVYAIEVARRQPDDTWCWLIGDPFTIGKTIVA